MYMRMKKGILLFLYRKQLKYINIFFIFKKQLEYSKKYKMVQGY